MRRLISDPRPFLTALVLAVAPFELFAASHDARTMRSLYFPVNFETCARLEQGILRQQGQIIAKLPAKRIFLYVFDVDRQELYPLEHVLSLSAKERDTGDAVSATILVSPGRINVGGHVLQYAGAEKVFRQFSWHIDARYKEVSVKIHCAACVEHQCRDTNDGADSPPSAERTSASEL